MVAQGSSVKKEVLRPQIPEFEKLDIYGRCLAEKSLRAALAKKNSLLWTMGSPRSPPKSLSRRGAFGLVKVFWKKSLASRASLRSYSYSSPW